MAIIEIKNDKLTVGINTFGSELMYIKGTNGTEFLWNGDKNVWSYRTPVLDCNKALIRCGLKSLTKLYE